MENLRPHEWLANELAERKSKNPRYSLRVFAEKLGFSAGRLSEYLSGKREISLKQAEKIVERLNCRADQRRSFLETFVQTKSSSQEMSKSHSLSDESYRRLTADAFSVVADWQHFAILSLMDLKTFRSDEEWIGHRLGLSLRETRATLIRLERVGLIQWKNGKWKKVNKDHATTNDVPSAALKISHRQTLTQAIEALDHVAVEMRDITSITMAIDIQKIPEAKKVIRNFRRKLSELLEAGDATEVYNLNIQLVPVTKLKKAKLIHNTNHNTKEFR